MKKKPVIPQGFVLVTKKNHKEFIDGYGYVKGGMFHTVSGDWQTIEMTFADGSTGNGAIFDKDSRYPIIAPVAQKVPTIDAFQLLKDYRSVINEASDARGTNDREALNIALAKQEILENQIDKLIL